MNINKNRMFIGIIGGLAMLLTSGVVMAASSSDQAAAMSFHNVVSTRILDTRDPGGSMLGPASTLDFVVPGLPKDATSVSVNLTVTDGTHASFLVLYPTDSDKPGTSSINWDSANAVANNTVVNLPATTDSIRAYNNQGKVNVVIDLLGYYSPSPTGSGEKGNTGAPGRDGLDGYDGVDGFNGIDGTNGIDGANGLDGIDGIDGSEGAPGRDGLDGADGAQGPVGPQGPPATTTVSNLEGQWVATNSTARLNPDGVAFGPYADGGKDYGSVCYSGMNGKKLSEISSLSYYARYTAETNTGGVGVPYLRVFLNDNTTDIIWSANTQTPNPDFAQGPFHEWVATSGTWRFDDDMGNGGETPFLTLQEAHADDIISRICISTGSTSGVNLSALLRWVEVNGETFTFRSN